MAQQGTVRGTLTDVKTGEKIAGATIMLMAGEEAPVGGAYSDMDGTYSISAPAGTYQIQVKYLSYAPLVVEEVELPKDNVNVLNLELTPEDYSIETVVIAAKVAKNTDNAALNMQKNSLGVINAMSSQQIARTGDSNVAGAIRRVSGVTVEGGKYVYVRGLGDRYSKATLNNAEVPGLDPNRNDVQMDMFPTALIDNIKVKKTFTPDMPGTFSGGLVDVNTKDFPDRFILQASASVGYNPQVNFNTNFLTYQGGKLDALGFDDGSRGLPSSLGEIVDIPSFASAFSFDNPSFYYYEDAIRLNELSKEFNSTMTPVAGTSMMDQSYGFTIGNQYELGDKKLGFIGSLSYRNAYNYYDNGITARWDLTGQVSTKEELDNIYYLSDERGSRQALWGALANVSFKPSANTKLAINYMHNQSAESSTRFQTGVFPEQGWAIDGSHNYETNTLMFQQRSLGALQLKGEQLFNKKKEIRLDWLGSYTRSKQNEPDLRFFTYDYLVNEKDTTYLIQPSLYALPSRYYRTLIEGNINVKANIEIPFIQWKELESKMKFGMSLVRKDRTFSETRLEYTKTDNIDYNGVAEVFFGDSTGIFIMPNGDVAYNVIQDKTELSNQYMAAANIAAAYGMVELPFSNRLKFVGGMRVEYADINTLSANPAQPRGELENLDFLPSTNFIFKAKDNMNLRLTYSRTLARPSFREIAPFASFDFVGDNVFRGNPNLERTIIQNADARWEWFLSPGELVAVSGFYKHFQNPIERVFENVNYDMTLENVGQAQLVGAEFEWKKRLSNEHPFLRNFLVGGNVTWVYSRVDMDSTRLVYALASDPNTKTFRPMFGQSPYTINGELTYQNNESGTTASVNYNVFGRRISIIAFGALPDIYELPRGSLNVTLSQRLGKGFSLKLQASNLLDPEYKQVHTFKGEEFVYQTYKRGRRFSVGLSYNIQ